MRVLFLTRSLARGGAERQLVILARGLREAGHSVSVALFYDGGPLENELRSVGVAVKPLGKTGRWDVAGFWFRLARLVREERPDIVHGYRVEPNILSVLLKTVRPGIRSVWGVRASGRDLRRYERFIRIAFWLECRLSHYPDLIIANSHAGKNDHVAHGFPAAKVVVIPNGVDTVQFRCDGDSRRRVRGELGVADNEKLVGLVARLDPMKDHAAFLEAAATIAYERTDVRFVCVGNGPAEYERHLRAMADRLGVSDRVTWIPARPDVASVYNSLDVLASSSCWGEGFSNVIGEAMACQVPCVVTDAGDSALIVGDTGVVVRPEAPEELAIGIRSLLDEGPSESAARGRAARARIIDEFGCDVLVQRTIGALESVL
jgi:glycosyltransferase involved in cell wall biosynthesis